jgi:hypothetical protein
MLCKARREARFSLGRYNPPSLRGPALYNTSFYKAALYILPFISGIA